MALIPYPPIPAPITVGYVSANTAKASDIIDMAFTLAGRKALGQPMDGDISAYALTLLRLLIDQWQADSLYVPFMAETIQTVSGSPITIALGQTISIPSPKNIDEASFYRVSGQDRKLTWLNRSDFNSITLKDIGSQYPVYAYYDKAMPVPSLHLWPKAENIELHLVYEALLPSFDDYSVTDYAVSIGYKNALVFSLAELACMGVRDVPQDIREKAITARSVIKKNNYSPTILQNQVKGYGSRSLSRFLAGF